MKKHVRNQGHRFSFRLRVLDRYVDAQESWDTEEEAAFFADISKHYLRLTYRVGLDPSLDGDLFAALAYRRNILLSSCLDALPPGVRTFIVLNEEALKAIPAPELREWEKLREYPNDAVRTWARDCESTSVRADAFKAINHEYLKTLLVSVANRLNDAVGPVRRAIQMHQKVSDPVLIARLEELHSLRNNIEALSIVADEAATQFSQENKLVVERLKILESNRPPLT